MPDLLSTPLQYVKGVGPRRAADLERVGLLTVEDLLLRFPLRYEDRAALLPVAKLASRRDGDGRRRRRDERRPADAPARLPACSS